jgi:transposase
VSGGAWEVARILERHVARVVVVSPADTGIRQARAKTDRLDARTLARLLAVGELDGVCSPDERCRVMRRRLSRREHDIDRWVHHRTQRWTGQGPRPRW